VKNSVKLNDEVDELYQLPLAEFTGARNELAARLKQSGRANDASLVKSLQKPPVSAWTVNQLYWNHRDEFDALLAAGKRVHKASLSGKAGELRASLDARREALSHLEDLATSVLTEAGHNPSLDTIRRINTTLEALSAQAPSADGPTLGRLSQDVDPPGFESLTSFMGGASMMKGLAASSRVVASQKSGAAATGAQRKAIAAQEARELKESRQARIAVAKLSLQTAKKSLADARSRVQNLETSHKKVHAEMKEAEKRKREAEERFKQASAAYEEVARRARSAGDETSEASNAVEEAKRRVEKATRELESIFREAGK
jgi:archaellum component FlaC